MGKMGTAYIELDEQETIINFSRTENVAHICTSDTTMKTRYNKLCKVNPKHWRLISDSDTFSIYECTPKSLISFRSKVTERDLSDDQRQAMANRLREARKKNSQNSHFMFQITHSYQHRIFSPLL